MNGKKKQELLNDYYRSLSVLTWLQDNNDLPKDKDIEQLAVWYAAGNSKEEAEWLRFQIKNNC